MYQNLIDYINSNKSCTPVRVYAYGHLKNVPQGIEYYEFLNGCILCGDLTLVNNILAKEGIKPNRIEVERRNSRLKLMDYQHTSARIEPGAIIRECVSIDSNAVIMMGAVLNIGAKVGENSMIDMNAVVGSRAVIGKNVHIGAGAVISGVLEPPSSRPCIIRDNAFIGANAVVLEGVEVGENAVVAAGAVVSEDVPNDIVVAGVPAKAVKKADESTKSRIVLVDELRVIEE